MLVMHDWLDDHSNYNAIMPWLDNHAVTYSFVDLGSYELIELSEEYTVKEIASDLRLTS